MIKHIIWELFGVQSMGLNQGVKCVACSINLILGNHLRICLKTEGKTKKTCDEVANRRALRIQTDFLSAVGETKDTNHPEFSPAPSLFKLQFQNNELIL
jgi:hypothetical protein